MGSYIYWAVVTIICLIIGWKTPELFATSRSFIQRWNQFVCFFVGGGGIGFYFWKVRWLQIVQGENATLFDFIFLIFFLMSLMGLTPYFLTNITKSIAELLKKAVEKIS